MDKMKIRKKNILELMKSTRVPVNMKTAPRVMDTKKGKGSYKRRAKHQKDDYGL
jgi:hypothetical protein